MGISLLHPGVNMGSVSKDSFTKKECKAYEILSEVQGESVWHIAIRNTLAGKCRREDFCELTRTLYEQMQDNRKLIVAVIGEKGVRAIERLYPSDVKKAATGVAYYIAAEVLILAIAWTLALVTWIVLFQMLKLSDHQHMYLYDPYEIKYVFITVAGVRKRIAVKQRMQRLRIIH
jgi:hypothetical protein